MSQKIDIVTVVYHKDLFLLESQARSIDLYINDRDINQITIVVNDAEDLVKRIDPSWYGKHQDKVSIKHKSYYGEFLCPGWESQQLYKLFAAAESQCDWVMVLDAKTLFVNQLKLDKLIINGKISTTFTNKFAESFASVKSHVAKLFDISFDRLIDPAGVPFYFKPMLVRDMITTVSKLTEKDFSSYFIENSIDLAGNTAITEFHLYLGYILYKYQNYDNFYVRNFKNYSNINVNDVNVESFKFINSKSTNLLTVAVHPTAYSLLDASDQQKWINFLNSKGLDNISYPNVN